MKKDKIFKDKRIKGDFIFDKKIADSFDDMLARSVPFYNEMQRMTLELIERYAVKNSNIYDFGCSTGNLLLSILKYNDHRDIKVIGIDYSEHMISRAKKKLDKYIKRNCCELQISDLNEGINAENASVAVMILVLQFIKPEVRKKILRQIYQDLLKGGCLIIIEKIICSDKSIDVMFKENYYTFKRRMGYSESEILNKETALEDVLISKSLEENILLLQRAGFDKVDTFFKWYNFAGIIGIKE